ncbi:hypothetical protein B0H34DRAFT_731845 [Crassisporium funariophilum]|nr:hypothetical protein B0H34DRAFT_731845 [Crassisporium funariophilum]
MPPLRLTEQQITSWLRAFHFTPNPDELTSIKQSLEYHEDRFLRSSHDIDTAEDPVVGTHGLTGCCGLITGKKRQNQKTLRELKRAQSSAKASANALRSLLSPIRRLPPELLSEIFVHCLPEDTFIRPSPSQVPLLLTGVCSYWRNICVTTPDLWASLDLRTLVPYYDRNEQHTHTNEIVKLWITRSGDCPLSLCVPGEMLMIDAISDTMRNTCRRWNKILLDIPDTSLSLPPGVSFPMLEKLEIHTSEGVATPLLDDLAQALLSAPKLTGLIWDNAKRNAAPLQLDWSKLTHLTLNADITMQHCLAVLSTATKMTHLSLSEIVTPSHVPFQSEITLQELESFVVNSKTDITPIFNALTTPNLRKLVLNLETWPHSSAIAFLRRSRSPLQSLNFYFPPLTEAELIECLQVAQETLKEFTVQGGGGEPPVTDIILDRLTDTGVGDVLCPKVEIIALYDCVACSDGRFARMAQSRLWLLNDSGSSASPRRVERLKVVEMYDSEVEVLHLKPLRSFGLILKAYSEIDGSPIPLEPEDAERLTQLRAEGLVLHAYTPSTGFFGTV